MPSATIAATFRASLIVMQVAMEVARAMQAMGRNRATTAAILLALCLERVAINRATTAARATYAPTPNTGQVPVMVLA